MEIKFPSPTPIEVVCVLLHFLLNNMMVNVHMVDVNIMNTVSVHISAPMFYLFVELMRL
jgi:hypothetical protein